ncbi:MAG: hypothetical protein COZ18_10320 [Flexibacter sp. CG_4_10_14_3_um_filter_32_15]|nr:MAG: hypothetical protein COZ18_10320 [Flexibacter sp. CG_4_10_14_3_um_filter_32_15]
MFFAIFCYSTQTYFHNIRMSIFYAPKRGKIKIFLSYIYNLMTFDGKQGLRIYQNHVFCA